MTSLADKSKKEVLNDSSFGEHNMLVYPDLDTFKEMYCLYSKMHLEPQYNEIVLIVTNYEIPAKVRQNLKDFGIDADIKEKEGSLVIVDSVRGYQNGDVNGVLKLAKSLVERAEKEGRQGVCVFGDMGSFFLFDRIMELLQYEISIPRRPEIKLKAFCSYHAGDYDRLTPEQRRTLENNHFRRIMPQN
jgi:hypothetical protein